MYFINPIVKSLALMKTTIIKLYSNCKIVNGAMRGVICDLQRNRVHLLPNEFLMLFSRTGSFIDIDSLKRDYSTEEFQLIMEYIEYVIDQELAFYLSEEELERFPDLSNEWDFPSVITNCILDGMNELWYFDDDLIAQLDKLRCQYIQIRFYESATLEHLNDISKRIENSNIKSVDIILKSQLDYRFTDSVKNIINSNKKIRQVVMHSGSANYVHVVSNNGHGGFFETTEKISSATHCGIIDSFHFSINVETYMESLTFNSCLNRKLGIDMFGQIKNCPSLNKSYGNIRHIKLTDCVNNATFQSIWNISKDKITGCKICEFRYICTDCRAYLEEPNDVYSKPLKCGYDPNTTEWSEWYENKNKIKTFQDYEIRELELSKIRGNF